MIEPVAQARKLLPLLIDKITEKQANRCYLDLGLGQATRIDRIEIHWPMTDEAQLSESPALDATNRVYEDAAELEHITLRPCPISRRLPSRIVSYAARALPPRFDVFPAPPRGRGRIVAGGLGQRTARFVSDYLPGWACCGVLVRP